MRDRIGSVKSTKKITDAMKLVAAAKVRRAQSAVLGARPFSENLVKVLYAVNSRLAGEDVEVPLTAVRPVKTVLLLVLSGDRGLCGGYNNFIIKKARARARSGPTPPPLVAPRPLWRADEGCASLIGRGAARRRLSPNPDLSVPQSEARLKELKALGCSVKIVTIGKKATNYYKRRPQYNLIKSFDMGNSPTTSEAQKVADEVFAEFVSEEVDKVELLYTRFVSLISSRPVVQTLLPLTASGQVCNVNGVCVDAGEDEIFALTSEQGKFAVKREPVPVDTSNSEFDAVITFEQDPNQILDALLPLYMNSQVLRALQESLASELAARMTAMGAASDNAKSLGKALNLSYNRQRQAKITGEIIGACAKRHAARVRSSKLQADAHFFPQSLCLAVQPSRGPSRLGPRALRRAAGVDGAACTWGEDSVFCMLRFVC